MQEGPSWSLIFILHHLGHKLITGATTCYDHVKLNMLSIGRNWEVASQKVTTNTYRHVSRTARTTVTVNFL